MQFHVTFTMQKFQMVTMMQRTHKDVSFSVEQQAKKLKRIMPILMKEKAQKTSCIQIRSMQLPECLNHLFPAAGLIFQP